MYVPPVEKLWMRGNDKMPPPPPQEGQGKHFITGTKQESLLVYNICNALFQGNLSTV